MDSFLWLTWLMLCADPTATQLEVKAPLITAIDVIDVPARESGALESLDVREGALVEAAQVLGYQDRADAALTEEHAKFELAIATEAADSDVGLRSARQAADHARVELERAQSSLRELPKSISQTELAKLRLAADQALLEVEQAECDLRTARLLKSVKENELAAARASLQQRTIAAPIRGMVVEVYRKPGEWLEPGDAVVRLLRLDRLRVEGFLPADAAGVQLVNRPVHVTVDVSKGTRQSFRGQIVFASPEIEPVSGEFRVWAEVENADLQLRPGLSAAMTVDLIQREEP